MPKSDLIANTWQQFDRGKVAAYNCAEPYAQVHTVGYPSIDQATVGTLK